LSLPLQAKLLTVIQNREVYRVGSGKSQKIEIRLICATNMPIQEMVSQKKFRQDLLYRINTVEIFLPPLRERREDIPLLVEHFLEQYSIKYNKGIKSVTSNAMKKLTSYDWPGNVREVQHAIERAVILCETSKIDSADFYFSSIMQHGDDIVFDDLNLEEVERQVIKKVLDKHSGNITNAAKELGLTRTSLYRRLEKYGI